MLLDALFRSEPLENPSVPVTGEAAETDNIFARDVYVSPETSMRLAAVYACIYVISSSVAQMPLHVMRKTNELFSRHAITRCSGSFMMNRMPGRPAISGGN